MSSCDYSGERTSSEFHIMTSNLFRDTESYKLVRAIESNDTNAIRHEVISKSVPVNFQTEEHGVSPLMIAVYQNKLKSVKCLLNLGADPNLCTDSVLSTGENSIIIACKYSSVSSEILKLLMAYKGDPNSREKGATHGHDRDLLPARTYALTSLIHGSDNYNMKKIRIMVEAGPDSITIANAMNMALFLKNFDVALYLIENGADYKQKYIHRGFPNPAMEGYEEYDVLNDLITGKESMNIKSTRQKKEIINYLERKGVLSNK